MSLEADRSKVQPGKVDHSGRSSVRELEALLPPAPQLPFELRVRAPLAGLSKLVECSYFYAQRRSTIDERYFQLAPDIATHVAFSTFDTPLGTHFSLQVAGASSIPYTLPYGGASTTMTIRIRIGACRSLLGIPACELSGYTVDLEDIWGSAGRRLSDQLQEVPQGKCMEILGLALQARSRMNGYHDSDISDIAATMASAHNTASPGNLADRLGYTSRHVQRRSLEAIGFAPRTFEQILRIRRLLRNLGTLSQGNWSQLASRCGYYDQAHLIRHVRRFCGFSPSQFVKSLEFPELAPTGLLTFSRSESGSASAAMTRSQHDRHTRRAGDSRGRGE